MSEMDYRVYDEVGDEYELLFRDRITPEDVLEHILYYRSYELIAGKSELNIDGVDGWFMEELKWQRI